MSWETLDQVATDSALLFRSRNQLPKEPAKPSTWGQAAELITAPFKGLAQGAMQSARVANRVVPQQAGNPLAMSASEQEEILQSGNITPQSTDRDLRRGADAFKPDALTSTFASLVLQDAARLIGKAVGYGVTGGPVAAVVGTGIDEGATGYMELRDRGVDPATAAKAGAVRGATTALGVALPVAGKTIMQTLGLAATGGPASFIAEQYLTHSILEEANYPELAAEHDPFDPAGLAVSALFPGVVGVGVHHARARRAAAPAAEVPAGMADNVEVRDAAHAAYKAQQADIHDLGDSSNPQARASHAQAVHAAAQAMDTGEPVSVGQLVVDPVKAQQVHDALATHFKALDTELRSADAPPALDRPASMGTNASDFDAVAEFSRRTGEAADDANLLHNLDVAKEYFPDRLPEVLRIFNDMEAAHPDKLPYQLMADAVDHAMENGLKKPEPADRLQSQQWDRAVELAHERPDMPVRLEDDGFPADPAMRLLEDMHDQAGIDKRDSGAFSAAVECFLRTGGP